MPRKVLGGLIQAASPLTDPSLPIAAIRQASIDAHVPFIEEAGKRGVQILGLQEIFNGPYFCQSQDAHWYDIAETVPGPTTELMGRFANGAEIVFNPSATVAGLSQYLWKPEQPIPVAGASGVYFYTPEGKRYIDFNSQLMCVNVGHGDARVMRAIEAQLAVLPYANPFMATEVRAKLGARLAEITPGDIDCFFFTNGGAEATENAIKIARAYKGCRWRRSPEPRRRWPNSAGSSARRDCIPSCGGTRSSRTRRCRLLKMNFARASRSSTAAWPSRTRQCGAEHGCTIQPG